MSKRRAPQRERTGTQLRWVRQWKHHPVLRTLFVAALMAFLPRAGGADRPEVEFEKLIGKQVQQSLKDSEGWDADPLLIHWVGQIGERVAAASPRKDIPVDYTILGSDVANALTTPGGHILVTRGLLDAVESDDELAVVLAHENAHHAKRHAMQQIGANLLFLFGSSFVHGDNSGKIRTGLVILNVLRTLHKSREMEAQADDVGLKFAYESGYDPGGLVHFFDGFDMHRRTPIEEYTATHPAPKKRLEAARKNPLVIRTDPAVRERVAEGYDNRGLPVAAAEVRAGIDPLILPPLEPERLPDFLVDERKQVADQAAKMGKSLNAASGAQGYGNTLQTLLLINNQSDIRWLFIAARAYAVQTHVEDLLARTRRLLALAPPTYDALASYSGRGGENTMQNFDSVLGRGEVREAVRKTEGVPTPLTRAARAVAVVLTDLNNRFLRMNNTQAWLRYGALEGLVEYAESELVRADKMSGEAWRSLAMARIRRYQARITELVPEGDIGRRARWYDLAQRRFGRAFDGSGPAGDASVRAALGVELSESDSAIEEGRDEETPWADWVKKRHGVPENVATALRMLMLDLEREFAHEKRVTPRNER